MIRVVLIFCAGLLIPGLCTLVITGKTGNRQKKMGITVTLEDGTAIDGEEYVLGMAASAGTYIREKEAWNAWVIVCRTNFMKAVGKKKKVKAEDLQFDYISREELEESNGKKRYVELIQSLEQALTDTYGMTLRYDGKLIDALYHEISMGKTVSSQEIYGVQVPYLVSVDSSQDVEASGYMSVYTYTYKECAAILKKAGYNVSEKRCKKLKIKEQTENGYVKTVSAGKKTFKGEEWQEIFELPSDHFCLEEYEGKLRIICLGRGHGMGMSLYGANVLAEKKRTAEEILSHYYPGTKIDV